MDGRPPVTHLQRLQPCGVEAVNLAENTMQWAEDVEKLWINLVGPTGSVGVEEFRAASNPDRGTFYRHPTTLPTFPHTPQDSSTTVTEPVM